MLTKISIKNFKKLNCDIELSPNVVFVGPNNSGKTSALQAIALWNYGLKKWVELRKTKKSTAKKRTGVPINRKDLYNIPVPSLKQIWKNLQVREFKKSEGKQQTRNITIQIITEGCSENKNWEVGLEFDFSNMEVCYVRLMGDDITDEEIDMGNRENIILLPPMSGLSAEEYKFELGAINEFIGQGKTADVLRNLCWYVYENKEDKWKIIADAIDKMFAIKLNVPECDPTTSKIVLTYKEKNIKYDLINGGRGFHQILLLLSYIFANSGTAGIAGTVVMIDEPDAHLEILRQKQVFNYLCDITSQGNSQLIIATHSEAILNEARLKSEIVAFLGKPHIANRPEQLAKSLSIVGFEKYLLAEQKGWVLFLEGSTDLDMLKEFAKKLEHPVLNYLESPFVEYVGNQPNKAREFFYALRESSTDLVGIALFDRLEGDNKIKEEEILHEMMWSRNEIENYLPLPEVLIRYCEKLEDDLFNRDITELVEEIIKNEVPPAALKNKEHDFWKDTKISDKFLEVIFRRVSEKKGIPIFLRKGEYYKLIQYAKPEEINGEVKDKLDKIHEIASKHEIKFDE